MTAAVSTYRPRLLLRLAELHDWLANARPGEVLEYHRGVLARDRLAGASRLPQGQSTELDRLAKAVLTIAETGEGHVLQRRNGADDYTYILIARALRSLPSHSGQKSKAVAP